MDMTKLNFKESSFDAIWACSSFLHIPKKDAKSTLEGFNRVLKNDGILYISVMEGKNDSERKNNDLNWGFRHFSDYKKEELSTLLTDCKFEIIDIQEIKTNWGRTFIHFFTRNIKSKNE